MARRAFKVPHDRLDLRGPVELRVHGVGGATPEELLDCARARWIGGERDAGFFEPEPPVRTDESVRLEAYSWGGLTSRSRLRALWVLLTPFALVNVAGWMIPRGSARIGDLSNSAIDRFRRWVVRCFGLAITFGVVLTVARIVIDMVGYQCAGLESCRNDRSWPVSAGLWPFANSAVVEHPGRRIAAGAFLVAAVYSMLLLASRDRRVGHSQNRKGLTDPAMVFSLCDPRLWGASRATERLRGLHFVVGLLAVTLMVARGAEGLGIHAVGVWLVAGVSVLGACVIAASYRLDRLRDGLVFTLEVLATVLLVVAIFAAATSRGGAEPPGSLPGVDGLGQVVVMACGALNLLLVCSFLFGAGRRHTGTGKELATARVRVARLLAGPTVLALAAAIFVAAGSGALVQVAAILGEALPASKVGPDSSGPGRPEAPIAYFDLAGTVAVSTLLTTGLIGIFVLGLLVVVRRRGSTEWRCVLRRRRLDPDEADLDQRLWARHIARSQELAQLTDRLSTTVVVTGFVLVVMPVLTLIFGGPSLDVSRFYSDSWVVPAATLLGAMMGGVLVIVARAWRDDGLRRSIGTLWDILVFWPSSFHPLAPSYGTRAVGQLRSRLILLSSKGPVVLSGHSQGSVVALAAMARLMRDDAEAQIRAALLTHGSPLTRLYSRFFPEYFHRELFAELSDWLQTGSRGGWCNLYRLTDLVGGEVDGATKNLILEDPVVAYTPPGEPLPEVLGHGNYHTDRVYENCVTTMLKSMSAHE